MLHPDDNVGRPFSEQDFEPYCVGFLQELGLIPTNGMIFSLAQAQQLLTGKTYTYAGQSHLGDLVRMSGRIVNISFTWDRSPDVLPEFELSVDGDPIVRFFTSDHAMVLTAHEMHEGSLRFHSKGLVSLPMF